MQKLKTTIFLKKKKTTTKYLEQISTPKIDLKVKVAKDILRTFYMNHKLTLYFSFFLQTRSFSFLQEQSSSSKGNVRLLYGLHRRKVYKAYQAAVFNF